MCDAGGQAHKEVTLTSKHLAPLLVADRKGAHTHLSPLRISEQFLSIVVSSSAFAPDGLPAVGARRLHIAAGRVLSDRESLSQV